MGSIVLDTGVITNYLSVDKNPEIVRVFEGIRSKKTMAYCISTTMAEVFYHLCKIYGKEEAKMMIINLIRKFPIVLVDLDESLFISSGILKCQHSASLSYNDCHSIAYCLQTKFIFYTTEKKLKQIPHNTLKNLKVKPFNF